MKKEIIFDWFTIFKFVKKLKLGKRRLFANIFIKKLILKGWDIFVYRPNFPYEDIFKLRKKLLDSEINSFRILYGDERVDKRNFIEAVYIDMGFFNIICGNSWIILWYRVLRTLLK